MPQLDPSTYTSQLFWLVVTFVVLYFILAKLILPQIGETLDRRQAHIDHDLERATDLQTEAKDVLQTYEAELAQARNKAQQEITAMKEQAARAAAAEQDKVGAKLAADLDAAEQRIATARQDAMSNVAGIAVELTGTAVERLTGIKAPAGEIDAAVGRAVKG